MTAAATVLERAASRVASPALQSLLQCPVCRTPMTTVSSCTGCGEEFDSDGGTPRLISPRCRTTVRYSFAAPDSVIDPAFYAALSYPPRSAADSADSPYHLDAAHRHVLEQLAGGRVLEIGCGGGQMRGWVDGRGLTYVGTDISKTRISAELQKHGGPDILCDAHFLPFRDGSFDVVYTAAVTEHIADPQLMMSEVWRVLKSNGRYLGNVAFLEPWHDDSYFHMTPLGAYRSLRRSGFNVENVWPGIGYSGYSALFSMGNRLTRPLAPLGKVHAAVYRFGLTLRRLMRHPEPPGGVIGWNARVAGAVDWIARKPMTAKETAA